MNLSIFRFTLNMHNHRSQASVSVFKGDTAVRLLINLTDGGAPYIIDDGCVAILSGTKEDGKKFSHRCAIINSTTIQYDFTEQTAICDGIVNCELTLCGADGGVITAPKFVIVVDQKDVYGDDFPLSEDEQNIFATMFADEENRKQAEIERDTAEQARVEAENARAEAEAVRVASEESRRTTIDKIVTKVSTCLIDENTPTTHGYIVASTGEYIDTPTQTNRHTTDFIELEQGVVYICEASRIIEGNLITNPDVVALYDGDKIFTRYLTISDQKNITLQNNEKYVRVCIKYDELHYLRFYPKDKGYEAFGLREDIIIPQLQDVEKVNIVHSKGDSETAVMSQKAVTEELNRIVKKATWNLAEDATIEYKKWCVAQWQTAGEPITTATYKSSFLVILDVENLQGKGLYFVSEKYATSYGATGYNGKNSSEYICFADENNIFIGGKSYPQTYENGYTVPDNAKYCYITFITIDSAEVADDLSNIGYYWVTTKGQDEHTDDLVLREDILPQGLGVNTQYNLGGNYIHARRPIIAFIFDGDYDRNADLEAIFSRHGVCVGFAPQYTTAFANNSKATYLAWQEKGHEILAHGNYILDDNTTYTDEQAHQYIKASYETLKGYGFDVHGFIGSHGAVAEKFLPTLKNYYDYASTKNNHESGGTIKESCLYFGTDSPYKLWRYSIQQSPLDKAKEAVDRAMNTNGLLLLMGHADSRSINYLTDENVEALLSYIEEVGAIVKTPYEAIKDYYSIRYEDIITNA